MPAFTRPDDNIAQLGLRGTERVAVFGSGAGGHSFAALRALGGNGQVVAIDVRSDLLDRVASDVARSHMKGLVTKHADYQSLGGTGFADRSFDVVVVPNTLFAAEHKDAMLREAFRILKLGGLLLIIDWRASYGGMGPQSEHIVTEEAARALAEGAGFEVRSAFNAGAQHYGLLCEKRQRMPHVS
jgi:ubiquinone/menaquinone biosynthesis C-methylase UbiE